MKAVAADVSLAAVVAAGGVLGTALTRLPRATPVDAAAYALVVTAASALSLRRVQPLPVFAVVTAATSVYLTRGYPYGPILLAFLMAGYALARHRPLRVCLPAGAVALVALALHTLQEAGPADLWLGLLPRSAWVVLPLALGVTARVVRESADRARHDLLRRHVHEERIRLAQEVHDVVGHGLAAIKLQADVALHVLDRRPGQAAVALQAISDTSGAALAELRTALSALRRPDDGPPAAPGLSRLGELRERMGHAGVAVRMETHGDPRTVPAEVDLAAFRIVQEALTNVLRHAGARRADVVVTHRPDALELEVRDDGTAARSGPEAGSGIAGMQARAARLGGTVTAERLGSDGFRVRAVLPVAPAGRPR